MTAMIFTNTGNKIFDNFAALAAVIENGTIKASEITQISADREVLGDDFLKVIKACLSLRTLKLCWCNIDEANIIKYIIPAIGGNAALQEVDLQCNFTIGDQGAMALIPLIAARRLRRLGLQSCYIGETGASALKKALQQPHEGAENLPPPELVLASGRVRSGRIFAEREKASSCRREHASKVPEGDASEDRTVRFASDLSMKK